jgi:hypothetical protein
VQFTGARYVGGGRGYIARSEDGPEYEFVQVRARDINSGFVKAIRAAREPLGSGERREIGAIEFCEVR